MTGWNPENFPTGACNAKRAKVAPKTCIDCGVDVGPWSKRCYTCSDIARERRSAAYARRRSAKP